MCIRDRDSGAPSDDERSPAEVLNVNLTGFDGPLDLLLALCLLYTSDADDDLLCVDLGGRRIIKKKKITLVPHSHSTST